MAFDLRRFFLRFDFFFLEVFFLVFDLAVVFFFFLEEDFFRCGGSFRF